MPDFTPRPTIYKGIQMRSRLEAGFADFLDVVHFDWEYEPCAFAGKHGQYLPDFRLNAVRCSWLDEPATVYVEVKPAPFMTGEADPGMAGFEKHMRRMAMVWESEPDAVLLLACNVPNEDERLSVLELGASPSEADPFPWPCNVTLIYGPRLTPALAHRLEYEPWRGRWWEH